MSQRRTRDEILTIDSTQVSSRAGGFGIDRLRYAMTVHADAEPMPAPTGVVLLGGRVHYTQGSRQAHSLIAAPNRDRFTFDSDDIDMLLATLDPGTVGRVGAELAGIDPAAVRFTDMAAVGPAQAHVYGSLVVHLARDVLVSDDALASPLVRAETGRHLATTMLLTFPNTALDALHDPTRPGPGRSEPSVVRRAVEFIDAHADQPIGLGEITAAAGVGARGLQHAFRRHRDTTPLAYLRRVRLAHAHADLRAGDPTRGDTVAAIAPRWGFTHPGRFSADYRRAFGCAPSETLRT